MAPYKMLHPHIHNSDRKELFSTDAYASAAVFSPDGKWMLFSVGDYLADQEELYRVPADGGTFENITHSPDYQQEIGWTPDSQWFVYGSGYTQAGFLIGSLYRVNINTMEIQPLMTQTGSFGYDKYYIPPRRLRPSLLRLMNRVGISPVFETQQHDTIAKFRGGYSSGDECTSVPPTHVS